MRLIVSSLFALVSMGAAASAPDLRPPVEERCFTSTAVERVIADVAAKIRDPKLREMFVNCFPNTLDTTVRFTTKGGRPDTFAIPTAARGSCTRASIRTTPQSSPVAGLRGPIRSSVSSSSRLQRSAPKSSTLRWTDGLSMVPNASLLANLATC